MAAAQESDAPTTSNHIDPTSSVNTNAVIDYGVNNEDHNIEGTNIPAQPPTATPATPPTVAPLLDPNDMRYLQPYKHGYLRYVPSEHNRPDVIARHVVSSTWVPLLLLLLLVPEELATLHSGTRLAP